MKPAKAALLRYCLGLYIQRRSCVCSQFGLDDSCLAENEFSFGWAFESRMKILVNTRIQMLVVTLAASFALFAQSSGTSPGQPQNQESMLDARQIVANAKVLAETLAAEGIVVRYGVSPNHLSALERDVTELEAEIEATRLLTWRAAWMMDQGRRNSLEASIAKDAYFFGELQVLAQRAHWVGALLLRTEIHLHQAHPELSRTCDVSADLRRSHGPVGDTLELPRFGGQI